MGELRNLGRWTVAGLLAGLLCAPALQARPIVFARSTTVMAEYRDGAMSEAQLFYAPKHNFSLGAGYLELDGEGMDVRHSVTYGRINFLAKRWNRESAQANVFLWGGAGSAYIGDRWIRPVQDGEAPPPSDHDHGEPAPAPSTVPIRVPALEEFAWHAGGQIDFETRRFYSSLKTDYVESSLFTHRADTLQFGFAPYVHDVDSLATWFIVSGRNYTGTMHEGKELAFLLRFFRKALWLEAGATTEGRIQAMAMFTF